MKYSTKHKEYLLVDGYNIIHAWKDLKKIAEYSLHNARDKLVNILQNYQGITKIEIIVVFDAHKVIGGIGDIISYNNITVVYTQEAETADHYIERASREMARNYNVSVATSDNLEQIIILGSGARRLSALELEQAVKDAEKTIRKKISDNRPIKNNQLLDNVDPEMVKWLESMRIGK